VENAIQDDPLAFEVAVVDVLAERYGWTWDEITELPAWKIDLLLEIIRIRNAKAEADMRTARFRAGMR
jgi:hypothetical protein